MAIMTVAMPEAIPDGFVPSKELAAETNAKLQEFVGLQSQVNASRRSQREILNWFAEDPSRCWAAGASNIYELYKNPDISKAIWGREVVSAASVHRFVRYVKLEMEFDIDEPIDIFEMLRPSITSTGMMTVVEQKVKALPTREDPARENAVVALAQELESIGQRPYRVNAQEGKAAVKRVFTYNATHGIVSFVNGNGPVPALKLNANDTGLAATVLHRLFGHPKANWSLSDNELTAWLDDKPTTVATVLTNDDHALDAISDALRAPRH